MKSPDAPIGPLRALIADRRGWIARALINVLDPSAWRAHHCHGALDLLRALPGEEPHAIVLHDDLQDMRLEDLLARLRVLPGVGVLTPVVVLSTRAQRGRRLELLRAGATEHFLFPSDPEALVLRLHALASARREMERLLHASLVEPETGLYSPAGIARRSREIATDATRRKEPLSCVVFAASGTSVDAAMDRPREIEVVSELGSAIQNTARASDVVGRVDNVVVVIAPATGQAGAQRLAERMQRTLALDPDHGGRSSAAVAPGIAAERPSPAPRGARAAYCAVADFALAAVGIPEMIDRAIAALHSTASSAGSPAIVGESIPLQTREPPGRGGGDGGNG